MKYTEHIHPYKGQPHTCIHCQGQFPFIDIAQAQNKSNAVCFDCYAEGKRIRFTTNTGRFCEGCGRKVNAGPCYYCDHGIKEAAAEYVVEEA